MAGEIDEIKNRIDLVAYIGRHVRLERAGANYKGLCPFHTEKTPSFVVSPSRGSWRCYGQCGVGGDIFEFAMKHNGWDFRQALDELAREAGVTLSRRDKPGGPRQRLLAVNAAAADVYYEHLLATPAAREYLLEKRGIRPETWHAWKLGFCGPGAELQQVLARKGFTQAEMVEAGLLQEQDGQSTLLRQRFWGRITFPIRDESGAVVGFGARILPGPGVNSDIAKFINTRQTAVFDKGHHLFGLHEGREAIRREGTVVLVEGYLDVVACHQEGFRNVVAPMGTALTEEQARKLRRYARRVVIALDPDAAGVKATERGLGVLAAVSTLPVTAWQDMLRQEEVLDADLRVMALPGELDPDQLVLANPQEWRRLVAGAAGVVDYHLGLVDGLDVKGSAKDKAAFARRILPVIRAVPDPLQREHYIAKLARQIDVPVGVVREVVNRPARVPGKKPPAPRPALEEAAPEVELAMLYLVAACPGVLSRPNGPLAEDFDDTLCRAAFVDLVAAATRQTWSEPAAAVDLVEEPERKRLAEAVARPIPVTEYQFRWLLYTLRLRHLQTRHAQVLDDVRAAGPDEDTAALQHEAGEIALKIAQLQRLLQEVAQAPGVHRPIEDAPTVR